ncbi:phage virion morphogenesis protein [Nitrosovibrio sp. Nv4]|uniref:phage virion morphogenesis protein n=1 Tax=Nitrosovibrio sp. Nv4 TaxID=1945880 RepID=UPI000BDDC6FC|nr:phage virion morphogenesis protein [Nitrosovibrio sp. Nv4]SOD42327.1 phage virion morphogenesis (putative tail completion) protein [Nitrosovibrio sp. Nv4]
MAVPGIAIRMEHNDAKIRAKLLNLLAFGRDQSDAMRDIAILGGSSTRERFRTEVGPDGKRWKPSLRVQISGGRTLTQDGHLGDSINIRSGRDFAEWGVNRIYAAIHQFGGKIKPKSAASLRFRLANGAFVSAKSVTIPARPYLGIDAGDEADILDILQSRIQGFVNAG